MSAERESAMWRERYQEGDGRRQQTTQDQTSRVVNNTERRSSRSVQRNNTIRTARRTAAATTRTQRPTGLEWNRTGPDRPRCSPSLNWRPTVLPLTAYLLVGVDRRAERAWFRWNPAAGPGSTATVCAGELTEYILNRTPDR